MASADRHLSALLRLARSYWSRCFLFYLTYMQTEFTTGAIRRPAQVLRQTVDGSEQVFVPVRGAGYARLDAYDYDRLAACGMSFDWFISTDTHGALHVQAPTQAPARCPVLSVARVVTGAAPSERVKFQDGDRLNLLRSNLRRSTRASVLMGGDGK
jgi:hypothetical protein